jgi:hypothetical protein
MRQLAVVVAVVVTALLAGGGVANAYPPGAGRVIVSDRTPPPNSTFTVTFIGCEPGRPVTFTFPGNPTVAVTTGADGTASTVFTAPSVVGPYTGTATCLGSSIPFTIEVRRPPVESIAKAGASGVGRNLTIGLGLIALGGALLVVARSRRRQPVLA